MKAAMLFSKLKTCESCNASNFEWREACYRCLTPFPKAEEPAVEEPTKPVDDETDIAMWVIQCGRCAWFNAPDITHCKRCRKPLMKLEIPK